MSKDEQRLSNQPAQADLTALGPFRAPDPSHAELLAAEVILRVAAQARALREAALVPGPEQVQTLADALMGAEDDAAADLVRAARLSAMPAAALYHGLVAAAVDRVGRSWQAGSIELSGMMRASLRVWRILHELRDAFVLVTDRVPGQEAVFALCPGECHTLGLTMTTDEMRGRGWDVDLLLEENHDALLARFDRLMPTTVALAATSSDMVLPLARLVVGLRAHLPGVWVMVGGSITTDVADILALTGADAVANDVDTAERLMRAHLDDLAARRVNRV